MCSTSGRARGTLTGRRHAHTRAFFLRCAACSRDDPHSFVARLSPRNHLGETISTPPDQTIGICNDGVLWYFRLNSEKEKEMTEEETKDFERKAKCEPLACLLLLVARTHCWLFQACVDEKAFSSRGEGDQDHAGQTA